MSIEDDILKETEKLIEDGIDPEKAQTIATATVAQRIIDIDKGD